MWLWFPHGDLFGMTEEILMRKQLSIKCAGTLLLPKWNTAYSLLEHMCISEFIKLVLVWSLLVSLSAVNSKDFVALNTMYLFLWKKKKERTPSSAII